MLTIKKNIPNILTCFNLLSGCIAVVFAFEGKLHIGAIWVIIAAVFDFLDGFSARLLKAYSNIGKELDSLADMVSFGLVPGVFMYIFISDTVSHYEFQDITRQILPLSAFFITVFSALRLAVFNTDSKQSDSFIGLATPANALFICTIPLALHYGSTDHFLHQAYSQLFAHLHSLLLVVLVFSALLVAPFPLFSLKFKTYHWRGNSIRYMFILAAAISVILFGILSPPLIIVFYVMISVFHNTYKATIQGN